MIIGMTPVFCLAISPAILALFCIVLASCILEMVATVSGNPNFKVVARLILASSLSIEFMIMMLGGQL
jgi:hypothetical protein